MERPSWNEYFKEIVQITSKRSSCERLKVGCLIVKENRIISQGYNGFLPGLPHESIMRNNHEQATVHGEMNAIADCAKRGVSCLGSTAYITHYPCINCFKLMAASGIKEVRYINDYRNDEVVKKLSEISEINIIKI
jgi:dCMP deaminase